MKHRTYTLTSPDNKELFIQEWLPEAKSKAVILLVHGMGEHSTRYDHWAHRFNNKDIALVSYDQRGHGKSDCKKGHPLDIQRYIEDLGMLMATVRKDFPNIPLILYGHSLGGNVVINYAINNSNLPDGLIATSPWLELASPPSGILLSLVKVLLKLAPGITLPNGLDAKDISRDPIEVEKYKSDPLVHDKISVGLFHTTHKAGLKAAASENKINIPFLLTHGTNDKITSHEVSSEFAKKASKNTSLKLWDEAYHELHHEPIREELFLYILDWLKEQKLA